MALIDSGAMGNYMSTMFSQEFNVPTVEKKLPYALTAINGANLGNSRGEIDTETRGLPMAIGKHHEEVTFDVVGIANHHIILGIPWLRKHNPTIV